MEPSRPLSAEEEALKKNTDCIYFLVSPFTCKKGNECEFRHSEAARVNPKDCWFWLNGNCLNPKCAFRHPPLDGLFGVPGTPSGLQAVTNSSGAYNPNKQGVACIFFQKGQCLKGEWCPFVHVLHPATNQDQLANEPHLEGNRDPQQLINGPHTAGNHVQQQVAKVSTSFPGTSQPVPWGIKECNAAPQQAVPKVAASKPVEFLYSSAKSARRAEGPPINALRLKRSPSPYPSEYEPPRSLPTVAPVGSDSILGMPHSHQPQAAEEHYSNGREADEFLGESSPGFDVLVDDQEDYVRESEYYHNEDEYGRASVHGGRNLNQSVNDVDYHHPDYEAIPSFDRDQCNGKSDYDCYGRARGQFDQDHRRASSERATDRISKRRPMHRGSSPDEIDGLDLRHRLLKRRRLGPKSPPRHDYHRERRSRDDHYVQDRYRGRSSGRERERERERERDRRHVLQESSFSSRLQGRITLPARSPPPQRPFELQSERERESGRPSELQSERARERGRSRDRLSPSPRTTNYKGRLQDRIKRAPNEEFTSDGRSFGARPNRRDDGGGPLNFAGPKSLAELKGAKVSGSSHEQPTRNISVPLAEGHEASVDPLTFEGPKLLSDILKRKRQTASRNDSAPSSRDESNGRNGEGLVDSALAAAAASGEKEGDYTDSGAENLKTQTVGDEEESLVPAEGVELPSDASEDHELENFDTKDGDFDDEAMEGEDFGAEEGVNAYQEDFGAEEGVNAYPDEGVNAYQDDDYEDDEDDFAKKVGNFFK